MRELEKGEAAVLSVQFAALVVVVILLAGSVPGQNAQSVPTFGQVYWGTPVTGPSLSSGQVNPVQQNASTLTVYFALAYSTKLVSASASRICLDPATDGGVSNTYTSIQVSYDKAKNSYALTFGPAGQRSGWICTYTVSLTDSLSQTATWVGTVQVR